MTAPDRRWSDADRELVAETLRRVWKASALVHPATVRIEQAAAVLDALTAAGWRREADVRQQVADEIERHANTHAPTNGNQAQRTLRRHLFIAARIALGKPSVREIAGVLLDAVARTHRTTPPTERTEEVPNA